MEQVTGASGVRSRLTLSPNAARQRSQGFTAATIQQTIIRRSGYDMPRLAKPSYFRDSVPTFGSNPDRAVGAAPACSACRTNPDVVRSGDRQTFAAGVTSAILRNLRSSSALLMYIGTAQRTVIALNEQSGAKVP
jgi:hypothetical protein